MKRIIRFSGPLAYTKNLVQAFEEGLSGKKIIIDGKEKSRDLAIAYGVEDQGIYDIYDYLNGDVDLYKASIEVDDDLDLIVSSFFPGKENFTIEAVEALEEDLDSYDYILIQSNDILDRARFSKLDNIIVGEGELPGQSYYISDEGIDRRIASLTSLNYDQAFKNYSEGSFLKDGFFSKLRDFFKGR